MTNLLPCIIFGLALALVQTGCSRQVHVPSYVPPPGDPASLPEPPRNAAATANDIKDMLDARRKTSSTLAKRISFSFRGTPLKAAVAQISAESGVGIMILFDNSVQPPLAERPLYLAMNGVELCDALDWITRQIGAIYTFDGSTISIASTTDGFFSDELVHRIYPLRTMKRYDKPVVGLEDLEFEKDAIFLCVKACLAEYLANRPDAKLMIVRSHNEFLALCSQAAHHRIAEVLYELSLGREPAPPLPAPDVREFRKKLAGKVICAYRDQPLVEVIQKLSMQAGVNIGINPADLRAGAAELTTLLMGEAPLCDVLDEIARRHGLRDYSIEADRGVWLHGAKEYPREGRLLWESGLIRSYYVEHLVKKLGLMKLITLIKIHVTPEEWGRNLPAMVYAPSGRLIFFHRREAHAKLAAVLANLAN
ncbi:MAG TPA: hypothetical protein VM141_07940 [Planctomycetota bacterium]|nr:hypothetical protein [Planctomycetota bacterium]